MTNMNIKEEKFSLIAGGPFFGLLGRIGLLGSDFLPTHKTAFILAAIAWLPLALFSMLEGGAWSDVLGHRAFYYDFGAYARFIIVIILLASMERSVEIFLSATIRQFSDTCLIVPEDHDQFIKSLRLADDRSTSPFSEFILFVVAIGASILAVYNYISFAGESWVGSLVNGYVYLSLAGWWALCVSFPLFWFLTLRWLWRYIAWMQLLWSVTKLRLRLVATHPDQSGGIGFLALSPLTFTGLILALSFGVAAAALREIVYAGAPLESLIIPFLVWLTIVLIIFVGPLIVFAPLLIRLKRCAYLEYSTFVCQHNRAFEAKWLRSGVEGGAALMEPDISSVSDLGAVFDAIRSIRVIPFSLHNLIPLVIAAGLPWLGIVIAEVPLMEILKKLAEALI